MQNQTVSQLHKFKSLFFFSNLQDLKYKQRILKPIVSVIMYLWLLHFLKQEIPSLECKTAMASTSTTV